MSAVAPLTIGRVMEVLDSLAAFSLAEKWDNVGLMVGRADTTVSAILVALDATPRVLAEAEAQGCNCIVTHHPVIFHPLHSLRLDHPGGDLLARAILRGLTIISCHTNLDVVRQGVSGALAAACNLTAGEPLQAGATGDTGFGLIGDLAEPMAGDAFLQLVMTRLATPVLKLAGPLPERVRRVAVCGGSGSELAETARERGADLYLTGEVKHSVGRWAEAASFCVVDAGHYPTEQVVIGPLAENLRARLAEAGHRVAVRTAAALRDPFSFVFRRDEVSPAVFLGNG